MIPDYEKIQKKKPLPASHQQRLQFENSICRNKFHTLLQGKWTPKSDITFKDYLNSRRVEMQMRLRKGWPPLLYHGDLRCGTKYPLPRVMHKNKTEGYYLDVPSQCDMLSESPCCRDDVGWCGNGKAFCECQSCIDFRQYLPAELADWETTNNCQIQQMDGTKACKVLRNRFTSVTFIGDSLVRHIFSSLLILLTNDKECGALLPNTKQVEKDICSAENQFTDSACHKKLVMYWDDVKTNAKYCKGMPDSKKPRLSFIEAYNVRQIPLALDGFKERLAEERPLVIVGIGVHDNFNSTKVIKDYLVPLVEMRNRKRESTLIWLNTHSSGPLKPKQFRAAQGNQNILAFNRVLKEFCDEEKILLMDTFNFTRGIHSFDGTHYGYEINRLKTQILLNGLQEITNS